MQSFVGRVIRSLADAEVEFVVVGGVSAVLHGVPVVTQDLDISYRRNPKNIRRLARALALLPARAGRRAIFAPMTAVKLPEMGPFRAEQLHPGDRYELDNGHPVYCAPAGGSHATPNLIGAAAVATDPMVKEAGVDTGFAPRPHVLRAPDVAIGNVPNEPGWVEGAPELAIEYADVGQDEVELERKIRDLLAAGTKFLWVVRLTGPRRVEVHERGKAVRVVHPGALLTAPGVLQNPVLVEALYDRDAANRATLTNLLQRQGYEDLEAVLAAGRDQGHAEGEAKGLRAAVQSLCRVLSIPLTTERETALERMTASELDALRASIERDRRWD